MSPTKEKYIGDDLPPKDEVIFCVQGGRGSKYEDVQSVETQLRYLGLNGSDKNTIVNANVLIAVHPRTIEDFDLIAIAIELHKNVHVIAAPHITIELLPGATIHASIRAFGAFMRAAFAERAVTV